MGMTNEPNPAPVSQMAREAVNRLTSQSSYKISDGAKAKMRARDERCRRAELFYKGIVFK